MCQCPARLGPFCPEPPDPQSPHADLAPIAMMTLPAPSSGIPRTATFDTCAVRFFRLAGAPFEAERRLSPDNQMCEDDQLAGTPCGRRQADRLVGDRHGFAVAQLGRGLAFELRLHATGNEWNRTTQPAVTAVAAIMEVVGTSAGSTVAAHAATSVPGLSAHEGDDAFQVIDGAELDDDPALAPP
jgi:hypothetical protein